MPTHYAASLQDVAKLAESRDPAELSAILGEYKKLMHETIEAEHGFVERFLGDQVSAIWGGLVSQSPQMAAISACRAAQRQLKGLGAYNAASGLSLRICIGISDDPATSRTLCRLAPARKAGVLIAEATRALCAETFAFSEVEPLEAAPGRPLRVFSLK
ncbi:MAG: hypothetical protein HY077_15450 [Elusimicrobia bacterium]|nr:hypothetical protein [Elusimicrobiota bacterium]